MKQDFIDSLEEYITFLKRPDVPLSKVISLLGKQSPNNMFGSMLLGPHDKRFSRILVRTMATDKRKLRYITLMFQKNPLSIKTLEEKFGKFDAVYDEAKKTTSIVNHSVQGTGVIDDMHTLIEGHHMEREDDHFVLMQEDGTKVPIPLEDIVADYLRFTFVDREPVPDEEPNKQGRR